MWNRLATLVKVVSITWTAFCLGMLLMSATDNTQLTSTIQSCVADTLTPDPVEMTLPKLPKCSAIEKISKRHRQTCASSAAELTNRR